MQALPRRLHHPVPHLEGRSWLDSSVYYRNALDNHDRHDRLSPHVIFIITYRCEKSTGTLESLATTGYKGGSGWFSAAASLQDGRQGRGARKGMHPLQQEQ